MTEELQELGLQVGHRRVGRLMSDNGIKIIRTQKYKATTDNNHTFTIAPNLLDQDLSADGSNQKWAGDISYIWIGEGWLYLAFAHCPRTNGVPWLTVAATARGLHPPHKSWAAILFT